jgi:hypothetical protein
MGLVLSTSYASSIVVRSPRIELVDLEVSNGEVSIDLLFDIVNLKNGFWVAIKPTLRSGSFGSAEDYSLSLVESTDNCDILLASGDDLFAHNVIALQQLIHARTQLCEKDFDKWLLNKYVEVFSYNYEISAKILYESGHLFVELSFERADEVVNFARFLADRWDSKSSHSILPSMKH